MFTHTNTMAYMEPTDELPVLNVKTHQNSNLVRSISLKHQSNSETISFAPPCFSTPSTPISNHYSTTFQPEICFAPPHPKKDKPPSVTYKCMSSVLAKDGQILSIAVLNGAMAYTGSESNVIRIWKLPELTECGQLKSKAKTVVAIQVTNDKVFAAYVDSKIRVWSRRTCRGVTKHVKLMTIPKTGGYRSYISGKDKMMKHMAPISSMDTSLSEDIIYSASLDKTVKAWRISDMKCMETIQAHSAAVNAVVVADNGVLYTASDDATVKVWRRNFGSNNSCPHALTVTLPARSSPVKALAFNAEAGILYGGCTDGYIHYWLKGWFSGQLQYGGILQGHMHAILCLTSFGNFVVSGSADSTVRIWIRQQDGEHICIAVLKGHRGPIRSLAAFPCRVVEDADQDGCIVCTGSMDGVLKLWRVISSSNPAGLNRVGSDYLELNT